MTRWRAAAARAVAIIALAVAAALVALFVIVPRIAGGAALTVLSGSMAPALHEGDLIAVGAVSPAELQLGDIVTVQPVSDDPALVTHRIVGLGSGDGGERVVRTRGDANTVDDPPIIAEQVQGRLMYRVPLLGYIAGPLGGAFAPFAIAGGAALLIAALVLAVRGGGLAGRRR